jgi:putative transposase
MARLARVVVPGHPQHLTQRGNRRQQTFFTDADYRPYKQLPAAWYVKKYRKSKNNESQ